MLQINVAVSFKTLSYFLTGAAGGVAGGFVLDFGADGDGLASGF